MEILKPLDAIFLEMEGKHSKMQVGGLLIFQYPKGQDKKAFMDSLLRDLRSHPWPSKRSRQILHKSLRTAWRWAWQEVDDIDWNYHVNYQKFDPPCELQSAIDVAAQLHSLPLDRNKPLWSINIIDGIEDNRFALILRTHHATVDGFSAISMMKSVFSTDPNSSIVDNYEIAVKNMRSHKHSKSFVSKAILGLELIAKELKSIPTQRRAYLELTKAITLGTGAITPNAMQVANTRFNLPISSGRGLSFSSVPLSRVKAVAHATGAKVNDVVLAMTSYAVKAYLTELNEQPNKALYALMPVSLHSKTDQNESNVLGNISCPLFIDESDPLVKLTKINAATSKAKDQLRSYPKSVVMNMMALTFAMLIAAQKLNVASLLPQSSNLVLSNVRFSNETRYLNGARLLAMYPMSVLTEIQGLNITVLNYEDTLDIAVLGCAKNVPNINNLARYLSEGLVVLESALNIRSEHAFAI